MSKKVQLPTYIRKCKKCTCGFIEPRIIEVTDDKIIRVNYLGVTESISRSSLEETTKSEKLYNENLQTFLDETKPAPKKVLKVVNNNKTNDNKKSS
jgi:hypothetical protein